MQNDKLLPCPFCGGEAELYHDEQFIHHAFVFCTKCEMQTRLYANGNMTEKAIKDWNTRKPMERIVEQLECLYKYNSEQATLYHDMEKQDAHTREMKDLYIDRANCYGVAIRTVKGGVDNGQID